MIFTQAHKLFMKCTVSNTQGAPPNVQIGLSSSPSTWSIIKHPQGYSVTANARYLACVNQSLVMQPEPSYFTMSQRSQGGFVMVPISTPSASVTANNDGTLSLNPTTNNLGQVWQLVAIADSRSWRTPTWTATTRNAGLPNIKDGVYCVIHSSTRSVLSVLETPDVQSFARISLSAEKTDVRIGPEIFARLTL